MWNISNRKGGKSKGREIREGDEPLEAIDPEKQSGSFREEDGGGGGNRVMGIEEIRGIEEAPCCDEY